MVELSCVDYTSSSGEEDATTTGTFCTESFHADGQMVQVPISTLSIELAARKSTLAQQYHQYEHNCVQPGLQYFLFHLYHLINYTQTITR